VRLAGRGRDELTGRDAVAWASANVSRGAPVTVVDCVRWAGRPHSTARGRAASCQCWWHPITGRKAAPPGVIGNDIDWLPPRSHGQPAPDQRALPVSSW